MKATDLMIGDWYCWEAEGKKYPMQVTKETFALSDKNIANFEPIPLTPEILEKNGFEKIGETQQLSKYYRRLENKEHLDYVFVEMHIRANYVKVIYIPSKGNRQNIEIDGCAVHELQHALKLCRIEKEIVL